MVSKLDIFYLPTRYVMCTIFAALLGLTFSSFLTQGSIPVYLASQSLGYKRMAQIIVI